MTLLRMSVSDIQRRVAARAERGYIFTGSKWQAMAYISERLIVEDAFVDPNTVYPGWVMKSVHYGMNFGIAVDVMQYVCGVSNYRKPMGALMCLSVGDRSVPAGMPGCYKELGYYAVRYE